MKVKISKYPTDWLRSKIHYNYMNKKHGYDWWENTTKFESFLERVEGALQIFYNATINQVLKYRKRRIKVHIDDHDLWSADNTLAHIIHPVLVKMRDAKVGTPFTDDEDVPENIRSTAAKPKENEWDTDEFFEARWEWIMNEMIHSFECEIDDDWEDQFYSDTGTNFEVDFDGKKKAWDRRQNGLRLFGKYYHNLWT
jgi:hypothetical protein